MRFVTKPELRRLIGYSLTHITRLEKEGKFPRRVQLGPCRVAWLESEVLEWMQAKVEQRIPLSQEE